MSRRSSGRATSAPKVNISPSVRIGLESIVDGNESAIRAMLSLGSDKSVVEGLIDCMGVSSISAEMLLANYFSAGLLGTYCRERIGKSDKGGAATLAERIAREWAKPSFAPIPQPNGAKRKEPEEPSESAEAKRARALAELMAKRAKAEPKKGEPAASEATMHKPPAAAGPTSSDASDAAEAEGLFASKMTELELLEKEAGVAALERAKITCEDVLSGLMKWSNTAKAAAFLQLWEESQPLLGCDLELMFEAVPRIGIHGTAAMAKAAQIIAGGLGADDPNMYATYAGDWDPDVISEEDKEAFLEAIPRVAS